MSNKPVLITIGEKTLNKRQWCRVTKIPRTTLSDRLKRGWPPEDAVLVPVRESKLWEAFGQDKTIDEWCELYGWHRTNLYRRMVIEGMSLEEALQKPIFMGKKYEAFGKSQGLVDWGREYCIPEATLKNRMERQKMTLEEALLAPKKGKGQPRYLEYKGRELTLLEWQRETGIPSSVIRARIDESGWTVEEALKTPLRYQKRSYEREG